MNSSGSHRRTVGWHLLFHYTGIGLVMVNGIVLMPLYLAQIPREIYGYWLATGNILAWLTLVDPGFSAIIQQRVATAYGAGDRARTGAYLAAAAMLALLLGCVVGLAGAIVGNFLHAILGVGSVDGWSELVAAFSWAVAGTALSLASFSITSSALGLQGSLGPGIIYTVTQLIALGLTVWWLLHGWGILALGFANFVRGLGLVVGGVVYLGWRVSRERIVCRFSRDTFREVLGLSGFTFIAKIPGAFAGQMDTFVAARLLGPDAAIILGLTRRGYDMAKMVAERPAVALMPVVSHLAGGSDSGRLLKTMLRLFRMILWAIGLLVAGFLALNDDFVRLWVGGEFYAGTLVNSLLAAVMALSVLIGACANLGFALGDVRGNSLATFAASLLTIGLVWVGAHVAGLVGIAGAPLISLVMIGAFYFPRALATRLRTTGVEWNELGFEALLTLGLVVVCAYIAGLMYPAGWLSFTAIVAGCLIFFALGIVILSPSGKTEAAAVLRRIRQKVSLF